MDDQFFAASGPESTPEAGSARRGPEELRRVGTCLRPYLSAYCRVLGHGQPDNPLAALTGEELASFPAWFTSVYKNTAWAQTTLSRFRVSAKDFLAGLIPDSALSLLTSFTPAAVSRHGRTGNALREKNPTRAQMNAVLEELDRRKSDTASLTAAWLRATMVSGLRPAEWEGAFFVEHPAGGLLCAPNSKNSLALQRGTGPLRHLLYTGEENAGSRRTITFFLSLLERQRRAFMLRHKGATRKQAFVSLQRNCQDKLLQVNRCLRRQQNTALGELNICLYSARHFFKASQFSALGDSKESRLSIAAAMGHASLASQNAYAPDRKFVRSKGRPETLDCEKSKVRRARRARKSRSAARPAPR